MYTEICGITWFVETFVWKVDFEKRMGPLSSRISCSAGFNFIRWLTANPETVDPNKTIVNHIRERPVDRLDASTRSTELHSMSRCSTHGERDCADLFGLLTPSSRVFRSWYARIIFQTAVCPSFSNRRVYTKLLVPRYIW